MFIVVFGMQLLYFDVISRQRKSEISYRIGGYESDARENKSPERECNGRFSLVQY